MVVAAMQGADQHIRRSVRFSILPKDTLTCRPGELNQFAGTTPDLFIHYHIKYLRNKAPWRLLGGAGFQHLGRDMQYRLEMKIFQEDKTTLILMYVLRGEITSKSFDTTNLIGATEY